MRESRKIISQRSYDLTDFTMGVTPQTNSPWIFGLGCVFAALFAYGLGANDVANSFGTSIGSGALNMKQAILIASVMEVAGAVTLGSGVANTLTKKISYMEREGMRYLSSSLYSLFFVFVFCFLAVHYEYETDLLPRFSYFLSFVLL